MSMSLSERDKKLLMILLVVVLACVPFLLLIQPMMNKCDALMTEISELQTRKSYLQDIALAEDTYRMEAERMTQEKEEMLGKFPSDITQEASLLFMNETEKMIPISLYQVTFGEDVAAQITSQPTQEAIDEVEEETGDVTSDEVIADNTQVQTLSADLTGISTATQFTYDAGYEEFKDFLHYINNYKERMVITAITASYSADLNLVNGNLTLAQYALKGEGRDAVDYQEPTMLQGSNNVFTQATGVFTGDEEGNTESDFFLMLSQPDSNEDAIIIGETSDAAETTYISSDENERQEVTISFSGEEGAYEATYSIGEISYEGSVAFTKEQDINFAVLSSVRAGENDQVEIILNIVNETDRVVNLLIENDDEENPRVTVRGKTGDIFER